ncbi:histidine phosphatase family protein [Desmospora profundinema]|uniref:Broad specificity phosphatase PhoE n=1 Tax=Desmospora profundinema TaxID=1571184 RepID=A0ABU1ILB4_9BACL|nr:histidine phosphatase family protein [Desmospora profundinema]MDR6224744.1 broad specificity phosphatase PhoE [Desmospora profundinema]
MSNQNHSNRATLITEDDVLPLNTKRIYLVRHAQSYLLGQKISMDPELTAVGIRQAEELKKYFATRDIDLIFTSELIRAKKTGEIVRGSQDHIATKILPELNEYHAANQWREWSDKETIRLIQERIYKPDQKSLGEDLRSFHQRVKKAWEKVLAQPSRNILIVTHNAVIRMLFSIMMGMTEESELPFVIAYPHASISEVRVVDTEADPHLPKQMLVIRYMCQSNHLSKSSITY